MTPLVSTIIPVFNAERYLAECVESAMAQTWKHHEIIVVDDGSSDGSRAIEETYARKQNVTVLRQPQRGACAARNAGLARCRGDFVQFLDADDVLGPDKVEQQVKLLSSCASDTISSCAWGQFIDDVQNARFEPNAVWQDLLPTRWFQLALPNGYFMQTATWLARRSLLNRAGPWNESLLVNQDGEYFARVLAHAREVRFCPQAKVFYRAVSGSVSKRNNEAKQRSDLEAIRLVEKTVLGFDSSGETRRAIASIYQSWIHHTYPDLPELQKEAEAKVRQLGPCNPRIGGTPAFQLLRHLVGWKIARRVERRAQRLGLSRVGIKTWLRKRIALQAP